jgi:hypothetical protein
MTLEEIKKEIAEFRLFARKHLKIKDKDGNIVPFVLNRAQEIVLSAIEEMITAGLPVRMIILKARQKGISTLIEAYIFWRTTYQANRKSAVIGHVRDATDNLWDMTNRYYDNLPQYFQPEKKYHNSKELTYSKTKSEMIFWTAETGDVGSSHTVQDLHITELSKWRDPKTTLTSLLQTVPDKSNTMIIMESTANGFGGEFYNRCKAAMAGKSKYKFIFLSWLIDDEYTLQFADQKELDAFKSNLDETEQDLLNKGATYEHLKWRREIGLPDKCGHDVDKFKQEYPSDPIEAFVTSGRPVFDAKICQRKYIELEDKKPYKIGDLEIINDKKVEFIENPDGYIKLFKEIKVEESERYVYAIGADVAEGLEQGDYSVIRVLDRRTNEVVLVWHGHIDADLLAHEQKKISMYLKNKCYIGTEFNNHGQTTVYEAYKLHLNQYYREDFTSGKEIEKNQLGFKTTTVTKPFIINDLKEWIREGLLLDYEIEFWDECRTFVRNARGVMGAQDKDKDPSTQCFDDRVMSAAIMIKVHNWMPAYYKDTPKEKDWDKIARQGHLKVRSQVGEYTF